MTYIYILERNEIPFYVGKSKDIIRREYRHHQTYGNNIKMIIIDDCGDEYKYWRPLEKFWISYIKYLGFDLVNKNNGGGGPSKYSEEFKLKMRKPRREGTGAKISKTLIKNDHSKYYTEEVRNKISIGNKNKEKVFDRVLRNKKISESLNLHNHSKYYTEEVREKMKISLKGSHGGPFSDSHIENIKISRRLVSKRIFQYDLNGNFIREWLSKGEAADWIKENEERAKTQNVPSQIKDCCLGRMISCWGYIWRFKDEFIPVIPKYCPIFQYLDGHIVNEFSNELEAEQYVKENFMKEYSGKKKIRDLIKDSIKNNRKFCNFNWKYKK